jgi:hypothetical protein
MPADYRKILAIVRVADGPARLADLIRGHRKKIGSRWRALPAVPAGVCVTEPGPFRLTRVSQT